MDDKTWTQFVELFAPPRMTSVFSASSRSDDDVLKTATIRQGSSETSALIVVHGRALRRDAKKVPVS